MSPNIKVLYVEDNKRWQTAVNGILSPFGYKLTFASSSKETTDILKLSTFQVAILDKNLNEEETDNAEGLSIAQLIMGLDEGTKIIVYTAYGNLEDSRDAFRKIKVWDFIGKDRPASELADAVKSAVEEALREQSRPSRIPERILTSKGKALSEFVLKLSLGKLSSVNEGNLETFAKRVLVNYRPLLSDSRDARLIAEDDFEYLIIRYWSKLLASPIAVCICLKQHIETLISKVEANIKIKNSLEIKRQLGDHISQDEPLNLGIVVFELENVSIDEFESQLNIVS